MIILKWPNVIHGMMWNRKLDIIHCKMYVINCIFSNMGLQMHSKPSTIVAQSHQDGGDTRRLNYDMIIHKTGNWHLKVHIHCCKSNSLYNQ